MKTFPKAPGVNYAKLQLTNIAKYSVAKPHISNGLMAVLNDLLDQYPSLFTVDSTITETNGGVAGLTIKMLEKFKNINVVEINPVHVQMIQNNIKVYRLDDASKNIQIYNNDYLDIMYDLEQDIIVSDPPWGGYTYKNQKSLKLGLNNVSIVHIINSLYEAGRFKVFILLAMSNFDIQDFINNIVAKKINIHNMGKHYFIVVFARQFE